MIYLYYMALKALFVIALVIAGYWRFLRASKRTITCVMKI